MVAAQEPSGEWLLSILNHRRNLSLVRRRATGVEAPAPFTSGERKIITGHRVRQIHPSPNKRHYTSPSRARMCAMPHKEEGEMWSCRTYLTLLVPCGDPPTAPEGTGTSADSLAR